MYNINSLELEEKVRSQLPKPRYNDSKIITLVAALLTLPIIAGVIWLLRIQ